MAADSARMAHPHRPRMRFSLADVLFFTLGICMGLAYWRWSESQWPTALFAGFACWLVVGLLQRLWCDAIAWRSGELHGQDAGARVLRLGLSVGALVLLAGFAAVEVAYRRSLLGGTLRDSLESQRQCMDAAFYLAVMAMFWTPAIPKTASSLKRAIRGVFDFFLIGLAAYWAAKIFVNIVEIVSLVHIAIRGVENAQPTRWAGKPFHSANLKPPPLDEPIEQLLMAFAALAVAAVAGAFLIQRRERGTKTRAAFVILFLVGISVAGYALLSLWQEGIYKLSPYFADAFHTIASNVWPGIALLILALSAGIALRSSVTAADHIDDSGGRQALFVRRLPAIAILVVAILGDMIVSAWSFLSTYWVAPPNPVSSPWPLVAWYVAHVTSEYAINWPIKMIGLAALTVSLRYAWLRLTGRHEIDREWQVRLGEFVVTWLVAAAVLALLLLLAVCWMLVMAIAIIPS